MMKLIPHDTDLSGMDCHMHSMFSPDSNQTPEQIVAAVRAHGLRGFIITDHVDIGHWKGCKQIDFDEYFRVWNKVRADNPDLTVYIGLEVGFDAPYVAKTYELIKDLPLEYVINSVHYWRHEGDSFLLGADRAYTEYLQAICDSLDAPYEFSTVGHIGFLERYAPPPRERFAIRYDVYKPIMDKIIEKTLARGARLEENTNGGGDMRLPRADFLRAYKKAGGTRPVLGSDAHASDAIGQYFDKAEKFLDEIF